MSEYKILKNVVYTKTDREYLTADIYLPVNKKEIPSVILMHGGGWKLGNCEAYAEWCEALAEEGICAMTINYRVATINYATYPGVLDDCEAAMGYLVCKASEWNLDPYKMGLMGDSSGAHIAFMTVFRHEYTSCRVKLIVGAYGVYDLPAWAEYASKKWPFQPNIVTNLIGKDIVSERTCYTDASPLYTVEKALNDNPMLNLEAFLLWGEKDGYVPCADQSEPFNKKLKNTRIKLRTLALPDAAHLWFPRDAMFNEINPFDKYPLSFVVPQVMEFIKGVFAKPRYRMAKYEGDYSNSKQFKSSCL